MAPQTDPLIHLLQRKPEVLKLLGRVWDILYIEGKGPEVGKRRENFIREILRRELGLQVNPAPPMERGWDFSIVVEGEERKYSLKTSESISIMKVAWNSFPSIERARRFRFKHPILYVTINRREGVISVYVFEVDDLEELKKEMGDGMWWMPKRGNPRGFGINITALKKLMEKAKRKGNFVSSKYDPIDISKIEEEYRRAWYNMLKELAKKG
ncbi:MAG: hypothetical protein ACO2O2_08495 [Acidilobaceae archaeon]